MRACIFALTQEGARLAMRLKRVMDGARLLLPEKAKLWTGIEDTAEYFPRLGMAAASAFHRYDALVFVMATGIVVRTIAPHIVNKLSDPAVLVFDERGMHGISLLSGHVGGANALARRLSAAIGADPVITTATDVEEVTAPDAISSELGLFPAPKREIMRINAYLLMKDETGKRREVPYYVQRDMKHAAFYKDSLLACGIQVRVFKGAKEETIPLRPAVLLTDRIREDTEGILFLLPRRLLAGVGCRKGTTEEEVLAALGEACESVGLSKTRIDALSSTTFKKNEAGLIGAAKTLDVPITFYNNEEMQETITRYRLAESAFVKETIGIGNVCEAAALTMAGAVGGRFALLKTKRKKVTVALLWQNLERSQSSASVPAAWKI